MPEKKLSVVPPEVTDEDLDDFLATDDLFIEYFNDFLQIPTFPEPLTFNKERGGFEVVSNAKQALKARIRTIVRSQQKPNPIYAAASRVASARHRPGTQTAGNKEEVEDMDFKTSFTVQCLNKEQGINWIKDERLPAFLQSDTYLEYRLAKIISQAEISSKESDTPLNLYIDLNYKPWAIDKPIIIEPPKVDEQGLAIRNMFVCMGEASTTQTKEWFSNVKMSSGTRLTSTRRTRPISALKSDGGSRPGSARPMSAMSLKMSTDSGLPRSPSPRRADSSLASVNFDLSSETFDEIPNSDRLFHSPPRPRSPEEWKPPIGDDCCVVAGNMKGSRVYSGPVHVEVVKATKSVIFKDESEYDDSQMDKISEISTESGFDAESQQNDSGNEDQKYIEPEEDQTAVKTEDQKEIDPEIKINTTKALQVTTMDQMALFIISYTIKTALQTVHSDAPEEDINAVIDQNLLKSEPIKSADLTAESLESIELQYMEDEPPSTDSTPRGLLEVPDELAHSTSKLSTITSSGVPDTSEVDSLFDDDSDREEEMEEDTFFAKPKSTFDLSNKKGLDAFKKFLWGTQGEKCWNLWLDIDRGLQIEDIETQLGFLSQLRAKYTKSGSQCEIPYEMRQRLGLGDPSKWTSIERLGNLKHKVAEPLLLYWAPRFLMRETYQSGTVVNQVYHHQKLLDKVKPSSHPEPKTVTLLPLRPKSCWPRLRHSVPSDFTNDKPTVKPNPAKPTSYPKSLPIIPLTSAMTAITPKQPTSIAKASAPSSPRDIHISIGSAKPSRRPKPPKSAPPVLRTASEIMESRNTSARHFSVGGVDGYQRFGVISPDVARIDDVDEITDEEDDIFEDYGMNADVTDQFDQSFNIAKSGSRPSSAASSINSILSVESELFGGRRMEGLLQGLYHEKKAGGFFMGYLEKLGSQIYINALSCWHELQEYHSLFYADTFYPYGLRRKAQAINSKYIVEGCFYNIECSTILRDQIYRESEPPFEELFDEAEQYLLEILVTPWAGMKNSDKSLYDKITLTEEERQLDVQRSKQLRRLTRKTAGFNRFNAFEFDADDEEAKRESYYESLQDKIPEEFKDYDFNKLIHNRMELEHYRQFLEDNYAITDLMCWLDIESFRRMPHHDSEKRDNKAMEIKTKYLNKKYFFGPNSPATRQEQHAVMQAGGGWGKLLLDRLPDAILIEAQKYVRERLARKWLPLFIATEEFQERQKPNYKIDDIADDMMNAKRKRCMAIYKILESKWISSSRDIISFRHALLNPVTCAHFRKYVSVKGENFENDVLFWLEVQKFKTMYHNHTEDMFIQQKIQAILRCFIDSDIPPHLHIDITPEQADKIVDKPSREMGPYAFREAQITVFRVLFQQWNDFQKYRNGLEEEKMLEDLEKKRQRQRKKEKEQRRLEEEREAKRLAQAAALTGGYAGTIDGTGDFSSRAQRRQSIGIGSMFDDLLKDEDDDEEDDLRGQEKYQWKFSEYQEAIERENLLLNGDDRASSIMSAIENSADGTKSEEGKSKSKIKNKTDGKSSITPHPPSNGGGYQPKPVKKRVSILTAPKLDGSVTPPKGDSRRSSASKGDGRRKSKDGTASGKGDNRRNSAAKGTKSPMKS